MSSTVQTRHETLRRDEMLRAQGGLRYVYALVNLGAVLQRMGDCAGAIAALDHPLARHAHEQGSCRRSASGDAALGVYEP